ncbi:hypothetical protein FKM82_010178 [Ascaphus truei]
MCYGMRARSGDPFLGQQQTLLAVLLWVELSLCFGPVQLTVGFEDLNTCIVPEVPENGYRTQSIGVFFENAVVRFHCQNGYKLKGPSKKMCVQLDNGSLAWKPSNTPECLEEVTDCLAPFIEDADVLNKTYRSGDKLIVSCREGFQTRYPDLDNMASLCQDDGTWDNLPMCQVCPLPPMVNHGDYVCHPQPCERYNHGTVIEFYCDPGYTLANDYRYITCQSGAWFPSYPVYCVKTDTSWPNTQETLLTTWKIVAFTASSVLLMLLFVIIIRIFQTKFKAHFLPRNSTDGRRTVICKEHRNVIKELSLFISNRLFSFLHTLVNTKNEVTETF